MAIEKTTDQAAAKKAQRKKRMAKIAEAQKTTIILDADVRKACAAQAKAEGVEMVHFMQKAIETYLLDHGTLEGELKDRLEARRKVIDDTVALARKIDADGGFDEHFVLTVMKTAMKDKDFAKHYALAVGDAANDGSAPAKSPLNRQLGRLIKSAVGAKGKRGENGRPVRAQVSGEVISTYTLLEKAS